MDSPMLARAAIVVGTLLVLISLFADQMGLGRSAGFGWRQILGVVVGALAILVGAICGGVRVFGGRCLHSHRLADAVQSLLKHPDLPERAVPPSRARFFLVLLCPPCLPSLRGEPDDQDG